MLLIPCFHSSLRASVSPTRSFKTFSTQSPLLIRTSKSALSSLFSLMFSMWSTVTMTNWFPRKNGLTSSLPCSLKIALNTVLCSRKQTAVNQLTSLSSLLYLPISLRIQMLHKLLLPQPQAIRSNRDLASSFFSILEATSLLILWSSKFSIKMTTKYSPRQKPFRPSLLWLTRPL